MARIHLKTALAALALAAAARADSRAPSEAAPTAVLRVVSVEGGRAVADGAEVEVVEDRRAARIVARFRVEAPAGRRALTVEAPPTGVVATWNGAPLPLERTGEACAPFAAAPAGIDPASGERYPLDPAPAAACEVRRATVDGGGTLALAYELLPGFDRLRRRRTHPEAAHLFNRRTDYFVYHFAARGPGGPVALRLPPRTDGTWRRDGELLRVAASESRHFPLGATVGVGVATGPGGTFVAARAALDALLPWGDALALSLDGDHSLRASVALTYQYHSRWLAFWPIGGCLEAGGVLDVNPLVRAGGRLAVASYFAWSTTRVSVDLFSSTEWRLTIVTGVGF